MLEDRKSTLEADRDGAGCVHAARHAGRPLDRLVAHCVAVSRCDNERPCGRCVCAPRCASSAA